MGFRPNILNGSLARIISQDLGEPYICVCPPYTVYYYWKRKTKEEKTSIIRKLTIASTSGSNST